jgi:hypothetical protein
MGIGVVEAKPHQRLADTVVGHDLGDKRTDTAGDDMVFKHHDALGDRTDMVKQGLLTERLDGVNVQMADRNPGIGQRVAGAERFFGGNA